MADADILAHFDNIPMLFDLAFNIDKVRLYDVRKWMKNAFEKDYNDLSYRTKEDFKSKYGMICEVIFADVE